MDTINVLLEKINILLEKDPVSMSAAEANDWGKKKGYKMVKDYKGKDEDLIMSFYKNKNHIATWSDGKIHFE